MASSKQRRKQSSVLSATIVPMVVSVALATGATAVTSGSQAPAFAANPCAAKNPCSPCGAKNPCNPCNPCGAANPCNPCGGVGALFSKKCEVPRLVAAAKANPCAAKKSCNPCAPKNACNPCAAKKACNPCNPCAAKANPCNPCAAKANPCNPCAAKKACNPCNPCGAAAKVDLTAEEAIAAYKCMLPEMQAAYSKSKNQIAGSYAKWTVYNKQPYASDTHGGRYVNNYANKTGAAYGKFEKAGKLKAGSVLAKDSFVVDPAGHLSVGPLFLMEKMKAGFNTPSGNWRYTLIGPDGSVIGETGGKGSKNVEFCAECHAGVGDTQDHLFFMPKDVRKGAK